VLTIEENAFRKNFKGFEDDIINLGPVSIESCPYVYRECDALFFPSLIETFTASYPEAMRMEKPIVTSDLPFAREICDNAALYFDPLNPDSIVDKIVELTQDEKLYADLKQKGLERLRSFETAASRASKILDILENKVKSN
jgi:glycosyltransferase involved in cell wall biosynthesis